MRSRRSPSCSSWKWCTARSAGRRGDGGRARGRARSRRGRCRGRCGAAVLPRQAARGCGTRSMRSPAGADRGHARPHPRRSGGAPDLPSTCPRSTGAVASGACPSRAAHSAPARSCARAPPGRDRVASRCSDHACDGGPNRIAAPVANESRHKPREPRSRWGFLQASCDKLPAAKEADDGPLDESADPRRMAPALRLRRRRAVPAPARLGTVPVLLPPQPGPGRSRLARLHVRTAARVRRRPHRGDRQHDPQVPPGRQALDGRRLLLLARPLDDRVLARRRRSRSPRRPSTRRFPASRTSAATSAPPSPDASCS